MSTNVSTRDLFATPNVTRVVRTIASPQDFVQRFLRLAPDNAVNVENRSGHDASWDIFNNTRELARARAPGSGPSTRKRQPAGHVFARIMRTHDKINMNDEEVFRTRNLGTNMVDVTGQAYVARQEKYLGQTFRNAREFMCSRMLRGSFMVKQDGDDWILCDSGGVFTVDYQVPAGNKAQLDILGEGSIIDASWATLSTDIPKQIMGINRAFGIKHGMPLRYALTNTKTFQAYVMNNTKMQAQAGTANTSWQEWRRSDYFNREGEQDTGFVVVHKAIPWLTWLLYDGVLDVDGTTTAIIPDDYVHFLPAPGEWVGGFNGSELVRENKLAAPQEVFGMHAWVEPTTQPSGQELIGVDNFLPVPYVPTAVTYAKVANY